MQILTDIEFLDAFKQQLVDQQDLQSEIKRLQTELDECRSQLTVLSLDYQSKSEEERKYQEDLSSLQRILKGNVKITPPVRIRAENLT